MKAAYPKKMRFVDAPIAENLIPDACRDAYGIDAVKLVRHLESRVRELSQRVAFAEVEKQKAVEVVLGIPSCKG